MSGNWKGGAGISGAIVAILAVIGLVFGGANSTPTEEASSARNGNVSINIMGAGSGCDVMDVATRAMLSRGFAAEQFVIGQDQVNWAEPEANERGEGAFVEETPKSATEVTDQLKADNESARAAKASLLETSGATEEELLDPGNWVPAQFKTSVELPGNTAFSGGEAQSVGTRQSDAGEVIWLFVNPEACPEIQLAAAEGDEQKVNQLAEDATTAHRAGCGNPQTELPVPPAPPPPPVAPPPEQPPSNPPPSVPPTTPPTTEKPEQDFDCQQNGTAPSGQPCDGDERQDPQDNDPEHVAPTPGAPEEPYVPPPGPEPEEGTPAPPPNDGGYDSGSPDGSGTPDGSTCDTSGCTGGGSEPAEEGPPPTVDDGTYEEDPGEF